MSPRTIDIPSGTALTIPGELYAPSGTASTGLVVTAYGIDGLHDNDNGPWETMIRGYAEELSKLGFFALIPHYFRKTGTTPGPAAAQVMMMRKGDWAAALLDSVAHARRTISQVDSDRIGLLGFSLGGHLTLSIRAASKPRALVEYFAPQLDGIGPPGHVPKAQIHHGTKDQVPFTDFSNAGAIEAILKGESTVVELFSYKDAGHGFAGTDAPNKDASALSQTRTLKFFETHL
jgi:dienelactone hydrolase